MKEKALLAQAAARLQKKDTQEASKEPVGHDDRFLKAADKKEKAEAAKLKALPSRRHHRRKDRC